MKWLKQNALKSISGQIVAMILLIYISTRGKIFPTFSGQRVSKPQHSNFVDLSGVDPANVTSIQNAIMKHGLFPYSTWQLDNFPKQLAGSSGHGLGIYQHPTQFGPYLHFIKNALGDRGFNVEVYAEIGVAAGGTFIFTSEFLETSKSYAVDVDFADNVFPAGFPYAGQLASYMEEQNGRAEFVLGDREIFRHLLQTKDVSVDLLMIDGDHSYDAVKADFDVLGKYAKVVAFHDIVCRTSPGVEQFWKELRRSGNYETHEFVSQYSGVGEPLMGIGVLVKQPFQQSA